MLRRSFPAKSSKDRGALRLVEPIAELPARPSPWSALRAPVETLALGGAIAFALFALPGSPWNPERLENRYVRATAELLALGRAPEGRLISLPEAGPPPEGGPRPVAPELHRRVRRLIGEPRLPAAKRAVLQLLVGDARAAAEGFRGPALANDRAAARLAQARDPRQAQALLAAFADLERFREPSLPPEARFNRALALERLQLFAAATKAWKAVAEHDPGSEWARAARRHLEAGRPAPPGDWAATRAELLAAAAAGRQGRVRALVDRWPQRIRLWGELGNRDTESLLATWALAAMPTDPSRRLREGDAALGAALAIGRALERRAGERLLLESAEAIASARAHDPGRYAALVEGHRGYRDGFAALNGGDVGSALRAMTAAEARLRAAKSPFAGWARYWIATCRYRQADYPGSTSILLAIEQSFPAERYPSLRAAAIQLRGLIRVIQGDYRGVEQYRQALDTFERLGEDGSAGKTAALISEVAEMLGKREEAWRSAWRGLELGYRNSHGASYDLYIALETLARMTQSLGEARLALAYQDEAVRMVRDHLKSPESRVASLRFRAELRRAAGEPGPALADLEEAERAAGEIQDFQEGAMLRADLAFTRGQMLRKRNPGLATEALGEAIQTYRDTRYGFWLASLHMERGRARALADPDGAEEDFEAALAGLESQRESVVPETDRITYVDRQRALLDEVVGFQSGRGRPDRAFATAERFRGLILGARVEGGAAPLPKPDGARQVPDLQARLDPDLALVELVALPDRLLARVIRRESVRVLPPIPIDRAELERRIDRFGRRLQGTREGEVPADAGELHRLLWAPLERELAGVERVVLVPDAALLRLPFAALWDASNRTFLIERHALIFAPSVRLFAAAADHGWSRGAPRLLAMADPALPSDRGFAGLPAARDEARAAAALFPGSRLLLGRAATRRSFLALADSYDLFHYAGHATADPRQPERSRLVLAPPRPDGPEEDLSGGDLAGRRFRTLRLAVLAGCRTGDGLVSESEGAMTLGRAFLGAGVPAVVTAREAIGDAPSKELLLRFYGHLARGLPLSQALRQAQRDSIRDLPPSVWAGMTLSETRPASPSPGSTRRSVQKS